MDWRFEEDILDSLALRVKSASIKNDPESLIISAMNIATYIEERKTEVFGNTQFNSLKVKLMSTSFSPFNYGGGDCGGYTLFLARLLKKIGFKEKIVQLKVNEKWGGHITLAVENGNKLLLIDPLYNYAFKDSLGHFSDIHDVANNWYAYYSKQLPLKYDKTYDYQSGWRFTNWDKFGFLSRSIYHTGIFIYGKEKMDNFSFRYWISDFSKYYSILSFFGFLLFSSIIIVPVFKKNLYFFKKTSIFLNENLNILPEASGFKQQKR